MQHDSGTKQALLEEYRQGINELDEDLLKLLSRRRKLSLKCAQQKQQAGIGLRDLKRENALLKRSLSAAKKLALPSEPVVKIFQTIFEDSLAYQHQLINQQLRKQQNKQEHPDSNGPISDKTLDNNQLPVQSIAILGGKGAYSHLAAEQYFSKPNIDYRACESFSEVIELVQQGHSQFAVIPIENTTSGGIIEVYDLLLDAQLYIVGEQELSIEHCLVGKSNTELSDIDTVVAHPQASKQCQNNLQALVQAKMELVESTAHALDKVVNQEGQNMAAIACEGSAELFGLAVIHKQLSDQKKNFTRFVILSKTPLLPDIETSSKTTVAISTAQTAGSLAQALSLFSEAGIQLTRLESRPIPNRPWEQMFYLDFIGHSEQPVVAKLLSDLTDYCSRMVFLGSYINRETYYEAQ